MPNAVHPAPAVTRIPAPDAEHETVKQLARRLAGAPAPSVPEETYSPVERIWNEDGLIVRTLPENIHACLFMAIMNSRDASDMATLVLPHLFLSIACFIVQATFLYFMADAVLDPSEESLGSSGSLKPVCLSAHATSSGQHGVWWLQHVALFTHVCVVWESVYESTRSLFWLRIFEKNAATHQPLRVSEFVTASGARRVTPASALTRSEYSLFFSVLSLQSILDYFCCFVGAGAVLRSASKIDIVLNAVAAVFITEVDDIFFKVFSANHLAQAWLRAPALSTQATQFDLSFQFVWPAVSVALVVVFHALAATLWCHELLGDINGAKLAVFTLALYGGVLGTLEVVLCHARRQRTRPKSAEC